MVMGVTSRPEHLTARARPPEPSFPLRGSDDFLVPSAGVLESESWSSSPR